ncbi:serine hydrolase domain-containing protein [Nocardia sp. CA-119907]|uniref:serine hydrolase domain-containing protein n=1 Tax=Nocardia sp. CA-119907 TaxID=3239973 RepID=UPI003D998450
MEPYVAPGFERAAEIFRQQIGHRPGAGAALSLMVDGAIMVDTWTGESSPGRSWEADTVCAIFSGGKGLIAACVLELVQRGVFRLEDRIASLWPEFAAHGKGSITIDDVMTHRAGLPAILEPTNLDEFLNHDLLAQRLADSEPFWPGKKVLAYHALTYGWIADEIVRRVTGSSVAEYWRSNFAEPLGLESWFGVPDSVLDRVATVFTPSGRLDAMDIHGDDPRESARLGNPPLFIDPLPWNIPALQVASIPGAGAISSARSMARFYASMIDRSTAPDGVWSPNTADLAATSRARGFDVFDGTEYSFSVGFQTPSRGTSFGPESSAFGHPGAGGSIHGAWPQHNAGFSFVVNELFDSDDASTRWITVLTALHDALTRA